MPLLLIIIVTALLGFLLWRAASNTNVETDKIDSKYRELLRLCRGNRDLAERLLNYELEANPNLSQQQALKLAIERYRRDQ